MKASKVRSGSSVQEIWVWRRSRRRNHPGRIRLAEIRYSPPRNSNPPSNAHRPVQQETAQILYRRCVRGALFHPRYRPPAAIIRPSVCALPLPLQHRRPSPPLRQPGHRARLPPALSGTEPSHATSLWRHGARACQPALPRPGSRTATSAGVNVRYRIRSSRPDVGEKVRRRSSWSSANIPAGTGPPT